MTMMIGKDEVVRCRNCSQEVTGYRREFPEPSFMDLALANSIYVPAPDWATTILEPCGCSFDGPV